MLGILLTTLLAAAAPVATVGPTPAPPKTSSVTGELLSVDVAGGTMTLSRTFSKPKPVRSPETLLLTVTPATQLFRASRPATLAELKAGDHVVVRYQIGPGGGKALSVRAAEPPAPKATPSPSPTPVPAPPR